MYLDIGTQVCVKMGTQVCVNTSEDLRNNTIYEKKIMLHLPAGVRFITDKDISVLNNDLVEDKSVMLKLVYNKCR